MKTAHFLFAVVGFGALTLGFSLADPPSNQPSGQESSENHPNSDHPANPAPNNQTSGTGDQTDEKHSPSNANSPTPEKIGQAGPTKTPPNPPSTKNPSRPPPPLNNISAIAKTGLPVNKPGSTGAPMTKPPVSGGTTALSPNIVRKPAGATASLGGLAASSVKTSTAGINGTGMKRATPR